MANVMHLWANAIKFLLRYFYYSYRIWFEKKDIFDFKTNDRSNYLRITYSDEGNELGIQILNIKVVFRQNDVLINGHIRHTLPYQIDDVIIRRASTVFTEVRSKFKLLINIKNFYYSFLSDIQSTVVIHYDSLTSRIYVKLNPSFVNRVRGLCGTYNYITNDV
jgi:hypothetical protein